MEKKEWGLVLSGGGGKGAYQIGVLKALDELGIYNDIKMLSGSSVGALNSALFLMDDTARADKIWRSISPEQFIEADMDMIDGKEGLVSREGLLRIIDKELDLNRISADPRTTYVTLSQYDSSVPAVKYFMLNAGSPERIRKLLLASSAMPIIYEPVEIDGHIYKDGGVTDNTPIRPLYIEGIRHFIVVGLFTDCVIEEGSFPGAEFVLIKPEKSLGGLLSGSLDYSSEVAAKRIELGYLDAMRTFRYLGEDLKRQEIREQRDMSAEHDYKRIDTQSMIDSDMKRINDLFAKYE